MSATGTQARRHAGTKGKSLSVFCLPGANPQRVWSIVTQVACEAQYDIARADERTLLSALNCMEACGGCSLKTKRRLIQTRLNKLRRAAKEAQA